jgi:hypothetical protein
MNLLLNAAKSRRLVNVSECFHVDTLLAPDSPVNTLHQFGCNIIQHFMNHQLARSIFAKRSHMGEFGKRFINVDFYNQV